jgi:hypothetical protein
MALDVAAKSGQLSTDEQLSLAMTSYSVKIYS